jgi:hypothetical protein
MIRKFLPAKNIMVADSNIGLIWVDVLGCASSVNLCVHDIKFQTLVCNGTYTIYYTYSIDKAVFSSLQLDSLVMRVAIVLRLPAVFSSRMLSLVLIIVLDDN